MPMSRELPLVQDGVPLCVRVAGASLDLFLVRSGNGGATGQRHFLFTANLGDTLCGLPPEVSEDWRFAAVGDPDSRASGVEAFGAADIDNWLANLTAALIGRPTLTAKTQLLVTGQNTRHPAGTRLTVAGELVWVCLRQGCATFLDAGPGFFQVPNGTYLPLVGRAWITVVKEAQLETLSTADLLAQGLLAGALSAFYHRLVAGLESNLADMEHSDRQRLAAMARCDRRHLDGALAKVVSVLHPGKDLALEAAGADDPLLAACRLVAKASRISLAEGMARGQTGEPMDRVHAWAEASGFRVRRVTLDKAWFRHDCGPLLVFRGDSLAPAAALPRGASHYDLYDPVSGRVTALDAATASGLSGGACMFYTPFPDRPLGSLDLLAFALRGQRLDLLTILCAGALAALLGLVAPVLTATVIDTAIPNADLGMLTQVGGLILVCALAAAAFELAKGIALLRLEGRVDARIQSAVTDRLLALPTAFFKRFSSGDLANRCLGINAIHAMVSGMTANAVLAAIFALFNLALLFAYDWQLALVANAFVLANMVLTGLICGFAVNRQREHTALCGRKQGMELEYLTGIAKLRLTGAEPRAFCAWTDLLAQSATLGYRSGAAFNVVSAVNAAFPTLTSMALFFFFFRYRLESLELGQFLSFYAAFAGFQVAMIQLVSVLSRTMEVIPLYERAKPILLATPEVDSTKTKPKALRGEIEVSHVVFRYEPAGRAILADISLRIAPGEFVALVGDSGAGKSTLLRLLLGFEMPQAGTISYDGQDLRELDVRAVRRRLGVVLQDDKPSAGSLYDNIAGSASIGLDEAWEAARLVGLEDDIKAMPMGMQTVIPPGGAGFSGGQIQRLLIARALVKRPRILFFDEATSALDNKTQALVAQSIAALKVTRVVIAHRLSTVMAADRIYALRQGQVAESGTFEELMAKEGFFHALAMRQIA